MDWSSWGRNGINLNLIGIDGKQTPENLLVMEAVREEILVNGLVRCHTLRPKRIPNAKPVDITNLAEHLVNVKVQIGICEKKIESIGCSFGTKNGPERSIVF